MSKHDVVHDVVHDVRTGSERESVGTLLGRVPTDVRAVISTHVAVYKIEAARRGQSAGVGIGFFFVAFVLLQAALVALLVGLIALISLSLGTGWAILVVVGTTLILMVVFAWLGLRSVKHAVNPDAKL